MMSGMGFRKRGGTARARASGLGAALALAVFCAGRALAAGDTIVSHSITTFGEPSKYAADFAHLDYVNPAAPKGGEISEATFGTFDSFNPYTQKGRAAALSSAIYEDMMVGTADEIGALYCLLCKTIEYPEDKAWVIFHLRPEVHFSDGTPMTADDVKFTTDLFAREGLVSFRAVLGQFVDTVEVIDPETVKYTFKPESSPRERIQMAGGMPVMSKAWFEKTGAKLDESRMDPGIGTGPYVLDSFDVNQRVVWRRDPDYWGKDLPINVGQNNFDRIRIEYFGDSTAALEAFKAGDFTFRNENSSKNWATAYDFPAIQKGWVIKAELKDGDIATGQSFVMNLRRQKFQDIRVREAIGLMFNFEWSNETLFYGLYQRINSFWENSDLAATGLPDADELALLEPLKDKLPAGVLDQEAVMAPVSGARQLDRGNLRKAAALLDAAGWAVGSDGMRRNAGGETLRIEFLEDDPAFDRVVNPFVENLRALGVDASLSRVDTPQYTARSRSFDFDIITDQFPTGYEPGAGLKQSFGTEGLNDVFNTEGLSDPAVDALIEKVTLAKTRAELKVAVRALDRVLRAWRFAVPQWYKDVYSVAYYDMYAHPDPLPPHALGELTFWWYDADKAAALKAAGAIR
ncbi:MAG: ABC transporter substrate-binding protein [Defluviimonas sp.]|uniref:extracellular solute-binding protein n=1 Tax=Albidovulum sp. TaxID=1872424 RepID=UPI001DFB81AA|nr:ABC transporter substrate-binding protein [Paracoccaceae bacterium]MCC0065306.1 ABC transporter substrate-binding protein [Defluviimonas sp.]